MKKIVSQVILGAAICIVSMATVISMKKPLYLTDAETRVGSYLSSSLGPTTCNARFIEEKLWQMECYNHPGNKKFLFSVVSAEKSPVPTSRSFYLVALNDNAILNAREGLMQYLQIGMADIAG